MSFTERSIVGQDKQTDGILQRNDVREQKLQQSDLFKGNAVEALLSGLSTDFFVRTATDYDTRTYVGSVTVLL